MRSVCTGVMGQLLKYIASIVSVCLLAARELADGRALEHLLPELKWAIAGKAARIVTRPDGDRPAVNRIDEKRKPG